MPDREKVLREALEAGIEVLREHLGDDEDYILASVPLLVEVMWPFIEGYHERRTVQEFEALFQNRFPNHVLNSYGGGVFDYIVGNVQTAVADEIVLLMESWVSTLEHAQTLPAFEGVPERDWGIAISHSLELISEVKQYRTRGSQGLSGAHTGSTPTSDV